MAVWAGLAAGLMEALIVNAQQALGTLTWASGDVAWEAPVGYAMLFSALAVTVMVGGLIARRRVPVAPVLFLFVFLGSLGWLFQLFHFRLHPLAQVLLAAGLAFRLAALSRRREAPLRRLVRRTAPVLALLTLVLFAHTTVWRSMTERRVLRSLPAAPAGAPNVLFIVLDTQRARSMSLYDFDATTTPRLEQWAARGAVFDRAFSTAPWTLPSHATMFTGRWPHQLEMGWERPLSARDTVLAEAFAAAGYRTAGFVANLLYTMRESGLARGFSHYKDHRRSFRQLLLGPSLGQVLTQWPSARQMNAPFMAWLDRGGRALRRGSERVWSPQINAEFLDWLDRDGPPFFAFLNYYDTHARYQPPREWLDRFQEDTDLRNRYDASIAHQDSVIGALLDELSRRGLMENTLVVIAGDHGELLGEHGLYGHGSSMYVDELHVPLLLWGPGVPSGLRVATPVSLRDVARTVAELAGLPTPFPGHSLAGHWKSAEPAPGSAAVAELEPPANSPANVPVAHGSMRSGVFGSLHYIRDGSGDEQLFDLEEDPLGRRDLSDSAAFGDTLAWLRAAVAGALAGDQ